MGPGLFFALTLLLSAPAGRAEPAAGLDAKGVDPLAAVDNRWGLDVRDALGRPVSGRKVLAEIKGAAVARAASNAFASRLPKAAAVLPFLEMLARTAAFLRLGLADGPMLAAVAGLPGSRPRIPLLWLILQAAAATMLFRRLPGLRFSPCRSRQSCPEVLRC